jgi:hypothetical protein
MDTIHKKRLKKDYPHFDTFFVGSPEYRDGYDRIFGSKNGESKKFQEQEVVQEVVSVRTHAQKVPRKNARKNSRKVAPSKA